MEGGEGGALDDRASKLFAGTPVFSLEDTDVIERQQSISMQGISVMPRVTIDWVRSTGGACGDDES